MNVKVSKELIDFSMIHELNETNFEAEVLKADLPVMVDCWGGWCPPCETMNPIIEQLATELAGKMKIAKLNVDDCQKLAGTYGVRRLPTFLIFKGGKTVDMLSGTHSKGAILEKLKAHM